MFFNLLQTLKMFQWRQKLLCRNPSLLTSSLNFFFSFHWSLKPGLLGLVCWPLAEDGWGWCKVTVPHPEEERPFFFWGYLWGSRNCNYSAELLWKWRESPKGNGVQKTQLVCLGLCVLQEASRQPLMFLFFESCLGFEPAARCCSWEVNPSKNIFNIQVHS